MKFNSFEELVTKINHDLGNFCSEFQYTRKDIASLGRTSTLNKLFGNVKDQWAINEGGGTEVQYHIAIDEEDLLINYGLGFNSNYVQFKNEMQPVEYIEPFMRAFIELKPTIQNLLPDYQYIYGNDEQMKSPVNNQYCLFGKSIDIEKNDSDYELSDELYNVILEDLKKQFEPYKLVFELRNILIEQNKVIVDMKKILEYKKQIILQGPPGTGKTYTAKDIAEQIIFETVTLDKKLQKINLEKSNQFKLIQFHPAYSYEDFVRGITAVTEGEKLHYKVINKIIGKLALEANTNYKESNKDVKLLSKEKWLDDMFVEFKDSLQTLIDENEKIPLTKSADVFDIDDSAFRYSGDNWNTDFRMPFTDIIKLYILNVNERKEIIKLNEVSGRARQHATYYFQMLLKFKEFLKDKPFIETYSQKVVERKYVLIIDEINRANLPAVLGELIYALEYRGEEVDSMYDTENEGNKFILPPNLFIIGTMNTADRSVGHIDYAIRRRFSFIDILPSSDIIDDVVTDPTLNTKSKALFNKVATLFYEKKDENDSTKVYLQSDFKAKDVQLGHSYFLVKSEEELAMKLEYEIKPLLNEYIKDGILNEDSKTLIDSL